jgi:hypothetical protein
MMICRGRFFYRLLEGAATPIVLLTARSLEELLPGPAVATGPAEFRSVLTSRGWLP